MDSRIPCIHSFPRSGTHLLAATLKRNFYADVDLAGKQGKTGHWKDRQLTGPIPYLEMFRPDGAHRLVKELTPDRIHFYIYRDGRDVAVSLWNAKVMLNPEWRDWSFSKFLRTKLDWLWTPGRGVRPTMTVVEQWMRHLAYWEEIDDVYFVHYEWLVTKPFLVLASIARDLDWKGHLHPVYDKVGVSPGAGKVGTWKSVFSVEDLAYFHSIVPPDHWGLWRDDVYD